ncbi:kinase-like domain-containing protein [Obelidium mucronatum]|nr:kinase-like domain-containing protein [Obelidium mucronatum]
MATTATPQTTSATEDAAGEELLLDRYRVTKILGEGSYGRVKLATDLENKRKVALKIINKTSIKKPEHVTRIKREVRILRLLNHPNIVKLYDVAETDKEIILSMEYIEGGELFDFIVANPRLNEKIARRIFRQIVSAVDYCHQSSVIHRDLKPENLLLDNDKNIKIIDFGFVNLYDPEDVLKTFCGSPFYASPEMILGKKYVGPEIDIWSMGVILFALLAGKLPFRDSNVKDLYRKITSSSFDLPSCIGKESGDLIKLMLKANPTERATLEQVRNHEWINVGYDQPPNSFLPPRPPAVEPLNKATLATMRLYGFEDDSVKTSILGSTTHPAFLLYSLIREHDAAEAAMMNTPKVVKVATKNDSQDLSPKTLEVPSRHNSVRRRKSIAAIGSATPNSTYQSTLGGPSLKSDTLKPDGDAGAAKASSLSPSAALAPNQNSDTFKIDPKVNIRARKSFSGAPTANMLRNEATKNDHPIPVANFVVNGENAAKPGSETTLGQPSISLVANASGKQLSIPAQDKPKERQRSLSFRYTSREPKKDFASPTEEFKQTLDTSTKGSIAVGGSTNFVDETSSVQGTLKPAATPQRRLSITSKIGHALSKIIQLPRSRRGSASPENSSSLIAVPRVSKNMYGVDTTSSKKPDEIIQELNRVFALNEIAAVWSAYKATCTTPGLVFDIEICSIRKTQMHGLELRRKKGSVWTYQTVCSTLISQLKL